MNLMKALRGKLPPEAKGNARIVWASRVEALDTGEDGLLPLIGTFVKPGLVEAQPGLYIVCSEVPIQAFAQYYSILYLTPEGEVQFLPPYEVDNERGWARRLRKNIAALLAEIG